MLSIPGPGTYYKKKPFGGPPVTKHNNMFEKVQVKFNHDMPQGNLRARKENRGELGSLTFNQ